MDDLASSHKTPIVNDVIESSSEEIAGSEKTPAAEDLFALGDDAKLDKDRADEFHHVAAKGLFVSKQARSDMQTPVTALCTRVKAPNVSDWRS